uniref:Neurochondrin n=1 Tax=Erpetoichthys calabaricus TaxID=27687 RepID=A0A8C4SNA7_ERPCA
MSQSSGAARDDNKTEAPEEPDTTICPHIIKSPGLHEEDLGEAVRDAEASATEHSDKLASQNAILQRCLQILKNPANDSEQFAALLLVTKVIQAGTADPGTRRQIFDAVGFSLPNRLLATMNTTPDCPPQVLCSLAVSLLAAFSTDQDLVSHPQLLNKVLLFLGLASGQSQVSVDQATIQDSYQCLLAIACTPEGPRILEARSAIPLLCQAYCQNMQGSEHALTLLNRILNWEAGSRAWKKYPAELTQLLQQLSMEFSRAEDQQKFTLCEILPYFLPPPQELLPANLQPSLANLSGGLQSILGSKLSIAQRDPALRLAACLLDSFGPEWAVMKSPGMMSGQFLALMVNLACVEVRMTLEQPADTFSSGGLPSRTDTITACYRILEFAMETCSQDPQERGLTLERCRQMILILEEAISAIIFYLMQVTTAQYHEPFIFASVRALCVWLAEETSSLKQEVCAVLPFLIDYSRTLFEEGKKKEKTKEGTASPFVGDVLRFLLPGLCHLTAEEAPRRILLSLNLSALIYEYIEYLCSRLRDSQKQVEASLQTACSVFLNLVITEPDHTRTDTSSSSLLNLVMEMLPKLSQKHKLVLTANFCTLGLLLARLLAGTPGVLDSTISRLFFRSALSFLSRAHVAHSDSAFGIVRSPSYNECWEDISELWFLGIQGLAGCLMVLDWLPTRILETGWLKETLGLLEGCSIPVDSSIAEALQPILIALIRSDPSCREFVIQKQGAQIACRHRMSELQEILHVG